MSFESVVPKAPRLPPDESLAIIVKMFTLLFVGLLTVFGIIPLLTRTTYPDYAALWDVLANISPFAFGAFGTAMAIAMSIMGAAWGILTTASSLAGSTIRAPEIGMRNLISILLCEAVAIYGLILAIMMSARMQLGPSSITVDDGAWSYRVLASGYTLFAAGMAVGIGNLACGISVGIVGSSCAIADATNGSLYAKILVIEIFASALGIFSIIIGILLTNKVQMVG
jgi:V-type H+-transporting ATPase proteolipid subunit